MDRQEPAPKQQKLCQPMDRQPIPRWRHATAQVGSKFYVWGGFTVTKRSDCACLEVFDFQTCQWEQIAIEGPPHPGFDLSACTAIGDKLYMFGGRKEYEGDRFSNALYQIDLSSKKWEKLSVPSEMLPDTCGPAKKVACGMVSHGDDLVVFAGCLGDGNYTNELHVYKTEEGKWYIPRVRGTPPSPRADFTWTKIDDHRALLFGGWDMKTRYNDTYILDMSDAKEWVWKKLSTSAQQPLARSHHSASLIGGANPPAVLVVGGVADNGEVLKDAWVWVDDPQGCKWIEVYQPDVPQIFEHASAVYAIDSAVLLLLHGGLPPRPHDPCRPHIGKEPASLLRVIECDTRDKSWRIPEGFPSHVMVGFQTIHHYMMGKVPVQIYRSYQKKILENESLQKELRELKDKVKEMQGHITDLESYITDLEETERLLRKELRDSQTCLPPSTSFIPERPTLLQLQSLTSKQGKEIRIMDAVTSDQWKEFGVALGFEANELGAIHAANLGVPGQCVLGLFEKWSQRGPNYTWDHLITVLDRSGLKPLASDLKEALCHFN